MSVSQAPVPPQQPTEVLVGAETIALVVSQGLASEKPVMIARNGTVEMEVLFFWFAHRRGKTDQWPYPPRLLNQLGRNAGVFPATPEMVDQWAHAYTEALRFMDGGAAGWFAPMRTAETAILNAFAATAFKTPLRSLEPYYVPPAQRWTRHLAGRRVAIVSSFADTAAAQARRGAAAIWPAHSDAETLLPPTTTWTPIRTYYAPPVAQGTATGWPAAISSWSEAVSWTVARVVEANADIALIGCGALGTLIAARLKAAGISSIVMGGAIQVLFGIKGNRWASHEIIRTFWGSEWVWPAADETPPGADGIEGACYWGVSDSDRSGSGTSGSGSAL